jgi:hypothetical protein
VVPQLLQIKTDFAFATCLLLIVWVKIGGFKNEADLLKHLK